MADLVEELRVALRTAANDDYSKPGTPERARHVQRLDAIQSAIERLEDDLAARPNSAVVNLAKQVVQCNGEWMPDGSRWVLTISDAPGKHFLTGAQIRELASYAPADGAEGLVKAGASDG